MRLSDAIIHLGVPRYADLMLGYDTHEPADSEGIPHRQASALSFRRELPLSRARQDPLSSSSSEYRELTISFALETFGICKNASNNTFSTVSVTFSTGRVWTAAEILSCVHQTLGNEKGTLGVAILSQQLPATQLSYVRREGCQALEFVRDLNFNTSSSTGRTHRTSHWTVLHPGQARPVTETIHDYKADIFGGKEA
ncbi:hypothetical protein PCH_Pc21g12550 [Penicillium rubens Wisconsin 54-1255]|uniref:Uncharacterized protein n=1 Tax=Penicillium rubens (strain ATCC 28089 / DSM 1075 / NRRL 1951 / Wisconsin 54-1255) TaxID=500485 RepID=B6HLP1_PENRW|nr:hypothetical protein PCH_Pc21g12550 [Penicillium rubens Wisconsin 54-1255]